MKDLKIMGKVLLAFAFIVLTVVFAKTFMVLAWIGIIIIGVKSVKKANNDYDEAFNDTYDDGLWNIHDDKEKELAEIWNESLRRKAMDNLQENLEKTDPIIKDIMHVVKDETVD